MAGSLGYAAQEPWLFNGSVRDNILFGLEYEEEWYQKVVDACCLREDVEQLSMGDMTLVGERGVSLSGGQKARVTLARYVYSSSDVSHPQLHPHLLHPPIVNTLEIGAILHILILFHAMQGRLSQG